MAAAHTKYPDMRLEIVKEMERQGLTARDLAKLADKTEQEVGQWIKPGKRTPTLPNLQALAGALGFEIVMRKKRQPREE